MDNLKINLINKVHSINCQKTLNTIFLIFKANKIKYEVNENGIAINLNQYIDDKLIRYIMEIIDDYDSKSTNIVFREKSKRLMYDINEYECESDNISIKMNKYKLISNIKKKKNNSQTYNSIIKLLHT